MNKSKGKDKIHAKSDKSYLLNTAKILHRKLPDTIYYSTDQWNKIRETYFDNQINDLSKFIDRSEKNLILEKSKAINANVQHTKDSWKKKVLESYKEKAEFKESRERELEVGEAELKKFKRNNIITAAKQNSFFNQPRVKQLNNVYCLTNCIHENEALIEYKQIKRRFNQLKDVEYHKQSINNCINGEKIDIEKKESKRQAFLASLKQQVDRNLISRMKINEEEEFFNNQVKDAAKKDEKFIEEDLKRTKDNIQLTRHNLENEINMQGKAKEIERLKEQQLNEDNKLFNLAKERVLQFRNQSNESVKEENKNKCFALISKLYEKEEENKRSREITALKVSPSAYEIEKNKRKEILEDIEYFRQYKMAISRENADRLYEDNLKEKNKLAKAFQDEQAENFDLGMKSRLETRRLLKEALEERKQVSQLENQDVLNYRKLANMQRLKEEEAYQFYANNLIDSCGRRGRRTDLLIKASKIPDDMIEIYQQLYNCEDSDPTLPPIDTMSFKAPQPEVYLYDEKEENWTTFDYTLISECLEVESVKSAEKSCNKFDNPYC